MSKSADDIIKELKDKYKGDNVGFILACESYRGIDEQLYEKIRDSSEYKMARVRVAAVSG